MENLKAINEIFGGGEAVSILTFDESGEHERINLVEEALEEVFGNPNLRDKRIMILSVSGAFRKGKSFLLCFFLRYLKKRGHRNENWIGKDPLRDGFHWRGGRERDTKGIQIWREPFFVNDMEGNEIAIFLMDTQGLFDHTCSTKLCTQIFAFSTLLSSVQILNVSQLIQEDTLRYLEFFTGYAQASQDKKIPFQKLMFLIRDWPNPDEHEYGLDEEVGGYVSSILQTTSGNSELVEVRKHLKDSFENLNGFFLPGPGNKVAVSRKNRVFHGEIEEIDPEFLDYVKILADYLLNPKNLVPKKIEDQFVTANDMINYAISCSEKFQSEDMPQPVSMMESAAISLCLKVLSKYTEEYTEEMKKTYPGGEYIAEEIITSSHKKISLKLLKSFDDAVVKFSEKSTSEPYRNKLTKKFSEQLEIVRRTNGLERKIGDTNMWMSVRRRAKEYKEQMPQVTNLFTLKENHEKHSRVQIKCFTEEYARQPDFKNAELALRSSLNLEYQVLERELKRKEEEIRVKQMHDANEKKLVQLKNEIVKEYQAAFKEFEEKFATDKTLSNHHFKTVKSLLLKFDSPAIMKNIRDGKLIQAHRGNVRDCLDEEFSIISAKNQGIEKNARKLMETELEQLNTKYLAIMNEGMKESYVVPKVLEESHKKVVVMIQKSLHEKEEIKERFYEEGIFDAYSIQLAIDLDQEYHKLRETNQSNKQVFQKKTKSTKKFFKGVGWVVVAVLGTPIALAFGIPGMIIYGVGLGVVKFFKGIGNIFK